MVRPLAALILALVMGVSAQAAPVDGALVESRPCPPRTQPYDDYITGLLRGVAEEAELSVKAGVTPPSEDRVRATLVTRERYDAELRAPAQCALTFYGSDRLKVAAYIWKPARVPPGARLPAIVMLRGGNRDFGKFGPNSGRRMADFTAAGFIVIGVQYRGVDGGEGLEQFGGDDVHDVLNALRLARGLPDVDPANVFLHGGSRGGMMVYLALKQGAEANAAVSLNALADLPAEARRRPEMAEGPWRALIPGYATRKDEVLKARSATEFIDQVDTPPILLLHGTADWRAHPDNSYDIARKLQARGRSYALHVFEGDVHGLGLNWRERDRLIIDWFRQHMQR
jgi:dipeptidyl aminopeptidase/acylaminoacyl peptidase